MRQMLPETANELSSFPVKITFKDTAGVVRVPDSATWTLMAAEVPDLDNVPAGGMADALEAAGTALDAGETALDTAGAALTAAAAGLEAGSLKTATLAAAVAAGVAADAAAAASDATAAAIVSPTIINNREDVVIDPDDIDPDTGEITIILTGDDLAFLPAEDGQDTAQRVMLLESSSDSVSTREMCEFTLNRLDEE
jgi:hypothetical protein